MKSEDEPDAWKEAGPRAPVGEPPLPPASPSAPPPPWPGHAGPQPSYTGSAPGYGYSAPPPVMSRRSAAALDDCCPSCRAEYPSLIRRLLRRGSGHTEGCPLGTLPLRLVAGLDEPTARLLLADRENPG